MAGSGGGAVETTVLCWVRGRSRTTATTLLFGDGSAAGLGLDLRHAAVGAFPVQQVAAAAMAAGRRYSAMGR
jgi:hypothetical protein